jgi:Flp pilus assembly protein TadG
MLMSTLARMKKMRGEDGASVVELACVLAFLGPLLLLGTVELSLYVYASMELADATHAAASYAAQYYYQNSNSLLPAQASVTTAATADSPELQGMLKSGTTFTATMATGCGTASPTAGNTVPTCTTGNLPYVQVTGSATVRPVVSSLTLTSISMTSQARINLVK